jgi:hypothetical protein
MDPRDLTPGDRRYIERAEAAVRAGHTSVENRAAARGRPDLIGRGRNPLLDRQIGRWCVHPHTR